MKTKKISATLLVASAALISFSQESIEYPITKAMGNPLFVDFPSQLYEGEGTGPFYSADASARVWNIDGRDVLYIYCSHDMAPAKGCDHMDRYHVFSTEDMINWTDHGEILNADDVRRELGWGCDGFMWAPDCVYNPADQLYYFYFPHPATEDWNNTWRIGVATSKYPDRDFKLQGYVEGMAKRIDPHVFIDDDGQPYIYNGGGGHCFGAKLKRDNWMELETEPVEMQGLYDYHEGTWIHKFNGRYYMTHPDNHSPKLGGNKMRYAVSDSPLGPWEDLGIYMDPTGIETNHGSIVNYKGQWYAFYHTGDYSGRGNLRSVCFEPITIRPDGTIEKVIPTWHRSYAERKDMK